MSRKIIIVIAPGAPQRPPRRPSTPPALIASSVALARAYAAQVATYHRNLIKNEDVLTAVCRRGI